MKTHLRYGCLRAWDYFGRIAAESQVTTKWGGIFGSASIVSRRHNFFPPGLRILNMARVKPCESLLRGS